MKGFDRYMDMQVRPHRTKIKREERGRIKQKVASVNQCFRYALRDHLFQERIAFRTRKR